MNPETTPLPNPQNKPDPAASASAKDGRGSPPEERLPPSGPRAPGEPYTQMPDFSKRAMPRWAYYAIAAVLALVLLLSAAWFIRSPGHSVPAPGDVPAAQSGAEGGGQ